MKSLNRKLALSALAIAMLATPALAKEHQTAASRQQSITATQQAQIPHYPNGGLRSGSAQDIQSGTDFNLGS
jgi:hypothetical protein